MSVGIDEAGRHDQVRGIDDFLGAVGNFANLGDLAAGYSGVGRVLRATELTRWRAPHALQWQM